MPDSRTQEAIALMNDFAERTGLSSDRPPQRYLWTDAFAVCNYIGLSRLTGKKRYQELALELVDRVHRTLGQYRGDDSRTGWIGGLAGQEGEEHPTRGGLRIGKPLPERTPDQAFDERLEWERDGQYFHYLSKWMHALDQVSRSTGHPRFNLWARELAETAHHAFTYLPSAHGPRRMYWKMSIDLKRPLVSSMGQHDPVDGFITFAQLSSTAAKLPTANPEPNLEQETRQLKAMIVAKNMATADPLGLGGLLIDAYRLQQLLQQAGPADSSLLESLLTAALVGLQYYVMSGDLDMPAKHRLAFRELGLAIGLHAIKLMQETSKKNSTQSSLPDGVRIRLRELMQYVSVGEKIESFWRNPEHRNSSIWSEHRNINEVMLATTLVPEGLLVLPLPPLK